MADLLEERVVCGGAFAPGLFNEARPMPRPRARSRPGRPSIVYIGQAPQRRPSPLITRAKLRRPIGALLVIVGAILMWLAPGPTFTSLSGAGLALLLAGVVLELVGIALERRTEDRNIRRPPDS
jgi:hypothetical protein